VPVDRKRGRITFLDREARTGAATVVSADVGKLSECLGFIPETSASSDLTCEATLEQHKDGSELVSATEATTWIEFAST